MVPPRLLEVFCTVNPDVLKIMNASMTLGFVPAAFKRAVVQPLPEKDLDPTVL